MAKVDRWAFLAGEGSLTVAEVVEWAKELGAEPSISTGIDSGDSLMVALVNSSKDRWRDEG